MNSLEDKIASAIKRVAAAGVIAPPAPAVLDATSLARLIDHTLLKPEATEAQVRAHCAEARQHGFASVCVNGIWAPLIVEELAGSGVKACAVAGFSLGATLPSVKAYEAQQVVAMGIAEVDMVINVGKLKDGDYRLVFEDIAGVADECHEGGALLKVIIEAGLLTQEEKVAACVIAQEAGADFVKTATGFNGGGATVEDVALMRFVVGPGIGVKAAGGVRSAQDALAMIGAGANRIGTSGGVRIMTGMTAGEEAPATVGDSY